MQPIYSLSLKDWFWSLRRAWVEDRQTLLIQNNLRFAVWAYLKAIDSGNDVDQRAWLQLLRDLTTAAQNQLRDQP